MASADTRNFRPQPTRLVLLDQIHHLDVGDKIRFLGCVHAYDAPRATLVLRERYPATTVGTPTAFVSVQPVLEVLSWELVQVGAWLNVVGYIRKSKHRLRDGNGRRASRARIVDALLIWSAGAIKLDQYRSAVTEYNAALEDASGERGAT